MRLKFYSPLLNSNAAKPAYVVKFGTLRPQNKISCTYDTAKQALNP
ncbi:hypothetical protein [uncultured Campylobacter sp.]|nr:hypothetical protein [uncultured Campylobacter sp.]